MDTLAVRRMVTSPGGSTARGLSALEHAGVLRRPASVRESYRRMISLYADALAPSIPPVTAFVDVNVIPMDREQVLVVAGRALRAWAQDPAWAPLSLAAGVAGVDEVPDDDPARIIRPEPRGDELGVAERELAGMQRQLQKTLGEQKHLADLGLAVSKINHDMRNILASAQLLSDRLRGILEHAKETSESVRSISLATQQQQSGTHQLADAMAEILRVTGEGTVATGQMHSANVDLSALARSLRETVRRFELKGAQEAS